MSTEHIPLRAHVLAKMDDCPLVARASLMGEEEDPTAAMEKGTTTHAILFNTQTVVAYHEGKQRKGKDWEAFAAEHDGCRIVTHGEYELAARMSDAVRRDPVARPLLENAEFEKQRLFKLDGRLCRATPDIVGAGYLADLKTGRSANPKRFRYNARDYYYDASMAWYRRAAGVDDVYVICVEKKHPYPVTVFHVNARSLAQGEAFNMEMFARFRECERTGNWPGYGDGIVELDIPERNAASLAYVEAEPEAA